MFRMANKHNAGKDDPGKGDPGKGDPGKDDPGTVGSRIRDARVKMKLTQAALGNFTGRGRTAVTQWESDRSIPDVQTVKLLEPILNEEASWIAYGIRSGPKVVDPDPEKLGYGLVDVIQFGDAPTTTKSVSKWGIPVDFARAELGVTDVRKLFLYRIESSFKDSRFEYGDLLIVDRGSTRPSPPGTFLYWDGIGPALADITVVPQSGAKKVLIRVTSLNGTQFEAEVDKVPILGRVRGKWQKI